MDLDNFEFKPLTDGLGFDKTTENSEKKPSRAVPVETPTDETIIKKESFELAEQEFVKPNNTPVSRSLKKMLDSLPPSVDFTEDKDREVKLRGPMEPLQEIKTPVYRPTIETPVAPTAQNFDVTLDNSLSQAFPKEETKNKPFYHQMVTPQPQYKEIATSVASAIIDFTVVFSLTVVFVIALVLLTDVNFEAMILSSKYGFRTKMELLALGFGINLFYFMMSRGMFGSSLGEYAFDVQLGSAQERNHMMYPFQVLFRTFMITITGLVLIPLISLGFGKDMGYYFSGLKLYSRQY
jgi:hypothetical protein